MPVKFKIKITKEIIERCKNCGAENNKEDLNKNCAVALALKDIFPDVYVTNYYIFLFGIEEKPEGIKIALPVIAQQFVKLFDGFYLTPTLRLLLPEFEFTISIPDEVINRISIDEIKEFINSCRHKKLIEKLAFS